MFIKDLRKWWFFIVNMFSEILHDVHKFLRSILMCCNGYSLHTSFTQKLLLILAWLVSKIVNHMQVFPKVDNSGNEAMTGIEA